LRLRKGRAMTFCVLVLVIGAIALSSSRGALVWGLVDALVVSVAFFWGAPWRQGEAMRIVRTVQRVLLGGVAAVVILFFTFPTALLDRFAFYDETLSLDSPQSELVYRATDYPLKNFLAAFDFPRWPYGHGLGTASLGAQYVARIMHAPPMGIGVENGYGEIILELGIVGLILWVIMSVSISFSAWRIVKKLRGSILFPIAFVIFWYVFMVLVPFTFNGLNTYQNFVMNAYLWLLIGVLYRLPTLKLTAQPDPDDTFSRRRSRGPLGGAGTGTRYSIERPQALTVDSVPDSSASTKAVVE
jgi:O-antigen ligase